jgi:uncharacterized protein
MMQNDLLTMLCCPENHSQLSRASDDIVRRLNAAIRDRRIVNRAGKPVDDPIDGGLVREDGEYLYPVIDGIPVLLRDDAIPLEQIGD